MKRISKKVTISLPSWLYEALAQEAERDHRPVSDHIRHLLWQYVESKEAQI